MREDFFSIDFICLNFTLFTLSVWGRHYLDPNGDEPLLEELATMQIEDDVFKSADELMVELVDELTKQS